jgi:hypothetical protein
MPGTRQVMWFVLQRCCLRDTEVQDLRDRSTSALGQEDVVGLQITVDDALPMSCFERRQHLARDLHHLAVWYGTTDFEALGERLPPQPLHHQVGRPIVELTDVEDLTDVRVPDLPDHTRLVTHPLDRVALLRILGPQDLHRDVPADRLLLSLVHRAHPTLADEIDDPILPVERRPDERALRSARLTGRADPSPRALPLRRRAAPFLHDARPVVGQTVLEETCSRPQWAQRIIDTRRFTVRHFATDCTRKRRHVLSSRRFLAPDHQNGAQTCPAAAPKRLPSARNMWTTPLTTCSQHVDGLAPSSAVPDSHQADPSGTHNQAQDATPRDRELLPTYPQTPQDLRTPREINLIILSS